MAIPFAPRAVYDPSSDRTSAILLRQGENAADAAHRSGQIWGGLTQNLGGIASGLVEDYQANKQAKQQALALTKRDQAFMSLLDQSGGAPDPKEVYRIFGPERAPKIVEGLTAFQQLGQKRGAEAMAQLPGLVRGLNAVPEGSRAALYPHIAEVVRSAGIVPPEAIPQDYSSEGWKGISDFVSGMEKPKEDVITKVGPSEVVLKNGEPIFTAPPKPENPGAPHVIGRALVGPDGKVIYQGPEDPKDTTDLSPAALGMAAAMYRKTGTLPPLGNGDKVTRKRILDRAATLTPGDIASIEASGLDVAGAKASYQADTGSLKKLQSSRDAMAAFEKTAMKNIDVFLDATKKIVDTGSPLLNRPVREISGSILGSPDQAKVDAARQVAINEIAKITNNPNLSGTLSDSARHEVEAFNPRSATLGQSIAVMNLLKQEIKNRSVSMDAELDTIKGRIGGKKTEAQPESKPAGAVQPRKPGESLIEYLNRTTK